MRGLSLVFGAILAIFFLVGTPIAAEMPPKRHGAPGGLLSMLPADSVTEHVIEAGGAQLAYVATAGTIALRDGSAEHTASVFYTAYRLKDPEPEERPVTFVFNGGPGASSVYLHLGLVGPYVAQFGPNYDAATARLRPNPDSWLRFTDLVLIDPVGTGWSRAVNAEREHDFRGVRNDAEALAKVVALYLARNDRLASPKYLLGESYGGFRAVKLARALQREQGIVLSGIVMVSPFLEGALQLRSDRLALGAALMLPSIAVAELDRHGRFTPAALAAAERFALGEYLTTLAGPPPSGDVAHTFYVRIAELTGLPVGVVTRARGFIADAYVERAASDRQQVVSPYDATFAVPDPFPESIGETGSDPMLDGFLRGLGGLFVGYAKGQLGFASDVTFRVLNSEVNRGWDWDGGRSQASVGGDLRQLLSLNPGFRLLIAHGRSDLVTPYGVSRYVIDHLPGEIGARAGLRLYRYGHMFYFDAEARAAFTADARAFYAAGRPSPY